MGSLGLGSMFGNLCETVRLVSVTKWNGDEVTTVI